MSIVDKHIAAALVLVLLGFGLTQLEDSDTFYSGMGYGIIAIASAWMIIRIIKEIKKANLKK